MPARSYAELDARPGRHRRPGRHHARASPRTRSSSTSRASTSSAGSSTASSPTTSRSCRRSHTTRAVVDRDELLKAVRLSALIASSAANVVRLRVGEDGERGHHHRRRRRRRRRRGPGRGARSRATAVTIAFNARYLPEALPEPGGGPARARVPGPALAGRAQADRTTTTTSTSSCRSARRPERPARGRRTATCASTELVADRLPELRRTRAATRRRAPGRRRRQRRRQDEPPRGHGRALARRARTARRPTPS